MLSRPLLFIAALLFLFGCCRADGNVVHLSSLNCATKDGGIDGFKAVDDGLILDSKSVTADTSDLPLIGFQKNGKDDLVFKLFVPEGGCVSKANFFVNGQLCTLGEPEDVTESDKCPGEGGTPSSCKSHNVTCTDIGMAKVAEESNGRAFKVNLANLTKLTNPCAQWKAHFSGVQQVLKGSSSGEKCASAGFPVFLIVLIVVFALVVIGGAVTAVVVIRQRQAAAAAQPTLETPAPPLGFGTSKAALSGVSVAKSAVTAKGGASVAATAKTTKEMQQSRTAMGVSAANVGMSKLGTTTRAGKSKFVGGATTTGKTTAKLEIALKIVEECLDEYGQLVETRPFINRISSSETSADSEMENDEQNEFKYLWVVFHSLLKKVLLHNTTKNYVQIAISCKKWSKNDGKEPFLSPFCDFVKCFTFVKWLFVQLKRTSKLDTSELERAQEMFRTMRSAYKIGREKAIKTGKNGLNAERFEMEVRKGLAGIKFGFDFRPIDQRWAVHVLTELLDNCKKYIFDVDKQHTFRNAYQMANISIKTLLLQRPGNGGGGANQWEIDGTCTALYGGYPGKDFCVLAKKLAYLSVLNRAVPIPARPDGCWPLGQDRNKAVRRCIAEMRRRYDAETVKMADFILDERAQRHFMDEFAFERQAEEMKRAIEIEEDEWEGDEADGEADK
ncbi:hypothetical protein niasHT_037920 [Heterodera trifolii]|uniref:Uncharacterized protein n=1 Tax=Heterodera trifolii TaxID=157864 RepID=A0ABD2HTD4_9BILA